MTAYREWVEAKVGGAVDAILETLRQRKKTPEKRFLT